MGIYIRKDTRECKGLAKPVSGENYGFFFFCSLFFFTTSNTSKKEPLILVGFSFVVLVFLALAMK